MGWLENSRNSMKMVLNVVNLDGSGKSPSHPDINVLER